ncbi:LOX5 lipoxygenase, partial [Polypterus senegalus]
MLMEEEKKWVARVEKRRAAQEAARASTSEETNAKHTEKESENYECSSQMVTYKLTVATGVDEDAGTFDYVYGTVIGELGQSQQTALKNAGRDSYHGCVGEYDVNCKAPLGDIWFVELEKRNYIGDDWFCRFLEVKCPDGSCKRFPCYRWFVGNVTIRLREGSAKKIKDEIAHDFLLHREKELQERQQMYRWKAWRPGIPKCIDAKSENDLPLDHRFNYQKTSDFKKSVHSA